MYIHLSQLCGLLTELTASYCFVCLLLRRAGTLERILYEEKWISSVSLPYPNSDFVSECARPFPLLLIVLFISLLEMM